MLLSGEAGMWGVLRKVHKECSQVLGMLILTDPFPYSIFSFPLTIKISLSYLPFTSLSQDLAEQLRLALAPHLPASAS